MWRFIWSDRNGGQRSHLVSWTQLCLPLYQSDLVLKSCWLMSSAFMAKLGWRILKEDHASWVRVLKGKYFSSRSNLSAFAPQSYSSLIWRGILSNFPLLQEDFYVIVFNGMTTSFWKDNWVRKGPLHDFLIGPLPPSYEYAVVSQY